MVLRNLQIVGRKGTTKDIKIEDGIISGIDSSGSFKNDSEINFDGCIAFPGLINSHDHLEFNLYPQLGHKIYEDYVEWGNDIHIKDKEIIKRIEAIPVDLRMQYGIIKNLLCGVTTVVHHGVRRAYLENSPIDVINSTDIHSVRLGGRWKLKINGLKNLEPYVIHIGEGINSESSEEINELIRWNLFRRKIIGIHGIAMTEEQSKNFTALIWCPGSNQFLFHKTADISAIKKSTQILFGTDSTLTGGWNIWEHLRKARELILLNDEDLFESVTKTAAEVWGLKNCGEISEGKIADVVIVKKQSDHLFDSFYQTNPEDILLVLKEGKVILFDESIEKTTFVQLNVMNEFNEVTVNGKVRFISYDVHRILQDLRRYNYHTFFSNGNARR